MSLDPQVALIAEKIGELSQNLDTLEAQSAANCVPVESALKAVNAAAKVLEQASAAVQLLEHHVIGSDIGSLSLRLDAVSDRLVHLQHEHTQHALQNTSERSHLAQTHEKALRGLSRDLDNLRRDLAAVETIRPMGNWTQGTASRRGDAVAYRGSSYISLVDDNREKPDPKSGKWMLLARRGGVIAAGGSSAELATVEADLAIAQTTANDAVSAAATAQATADANTTNKADKDGSNLEDGAVDYANLSDGVKSMIAGWLSQGTTMAGSVTGDAFILPQLTQLEFCTIGLNDRLISGGDVNGVHYRYSSEHLEPVNAYLNGVTVLRATLDNSTEQIITAELADGTTWPPVVNPKISWSEALLQGMIWCPGWGQSLETGADSTVVNSSAEFPANALMFNTGIRDGMAASVTASAITGFVPLVQSSSSPSKEAPQSGRANQLVNDLRSRSGIEPTFLFTASALGGSSYTDLKRGTTYYQNILTQAERAVALAAARDQEVYIPAVFVCHGEADEDEGTSATQYAYYMDEFQRNLAQDLSAITGKFEDPVILMYQTSSWTAYGNTTPTSAIAQLAAMKANEKIRVTNPNYIFEYQDGTLGTSKAHLQRKDYVVLGEYQGRALYRMLRGFDPLPVYPTATSLSGNVVSITFNVPVQPLVLDEERVTDPGNYGFEYYDSTSSASVSAVTVNANGVSIDITLDATPSGADKAIRYAYTSVSGNIPGITTGPRGCLHDSAEQFSYYWNNQDGSPVSYYLRNYSLTFDESIS